MALKWKNLYKIKQEAKQLYDLAVSLDELGAQVILLECLDNSLAKKISQNCSAPVIGIGSGVGIDGQVAVIYDLLGISSVSYTHLTLPTKRIV